MIFINQAPIVYFNQLLGAAHTQKLLDMIFLEKLLLKFNSFFGVLGASDRRLVRGSTDIRILAFWHFGTLVYSYQHSELLLKKKISHAPIQFISIRVLYWHRNGFFIF